MTELLQNKNEERQFQTFSAGGKKKNGFLIHLNGLFRFDRKVIFITSAETGKEDSHKN
jgi:hypothetical protein